MRLKRFIFLLFLISSICCANVSASESMRGIWVSTAYGLDYPSRAGLTPKQLAEEADEIIKNTAELGLNAIFFQVRPCADSFYPSEIFPWSQYLCGTQGQAPAGGFDPLEYFIEKSHAAGIELHCWLNPYRVTRKAADSKEAALALLAEDHPARLDPELVVFHSDGCLYFDPGRPEAVQLILDGISEITDNYDVDGIHFDDYFYPGHEFEDADTYAQFGGGFDSVEDFRRSAVNGFVSRVKSITDSADHDIAFGASPFGIWANSSDMPGGSDTIGSQSYFDHYADSLYWVKNGLIDYIAPQLYWAIGNNEGEFSELLRWWADAARGTGVSLYIGQAAYRMTDALPDSPWFGVGELSRQLDMIDQSTAEGSIFFRYSSITGCRPLYWMLRSRFAPDESTPGCQALSVTVGTDRYTVNDSVYLAGCSDISAPLFLNGKEVGGRTKSGYFGMTAPLSMGENVFAFSNGADEQRFSVFRQVSPANRTSSLGGVMPQYDAYSAEAPSDVIGCRAPAGAVVLASAGGSAVRLYDDGSGSYSARNRTPGFTGHVMYTCLKNNIVTVKISHGQRQEAVPLSATVKNDMCDLYYAPDLSQGAGGFLRKGMAFNIEHTEKGFAYSETLGYIRLDDLDLDFENRIEPVSLTDIGVSNDSITFRTASPCSAVAEYDDSAIRLTVPDAERAFLFEGPAVDSAEVTIENGCAVYTITPSGPISGFETVYQNGRITLTLHHRPTPKDLLILIDPGHGGTAAGAPGLETGSAEKDINLAGALELKTQLEALGMKAVMTREGDDDLSLRVRLDEVFSQKPDLLISIHANSAAQPADASALSGTELYAKSRLASGISESIALRLGQMNEPVRQIYGSRLYLCRPETCPALLLECQYMISPDGYEKLTDRRFLSEYYSAVAQGIYDHFNR